MRAWGNRADTAVIDEPLYAHYLHATGADHPAADEVIAAGETDWRIVVQHLTTGAPRGKPIFYQKHMTHHFLAQVSRDWLASLSNCFLIREPRDVIASYIKKNHDPTAEDLGFPQQVEIFDFVRKRTGAIPPVIDAADVLEDPRRTLTLLCETLGVEFSETMLSWPPGLRDTDGVWAKHWYTEVASSSGFRAPAVTHHDVPKRLKSVYAACREIYERLAEFRLR